MISNHSWLQRKDRICHQIIFQVCRYFRINCSSEIMWIAPTSLRKYQDRLPEAIGDIKLKNYLKNLSKLQDSFSNFRLVATVGCRLKVTNSALKTNLLMIHFILQKFHRGAKGISWHLVETTRPCKCCSIFTPSIVDIQNFTQRNQLYFQHQKYSRLKRNIDIGAHFTL